MEAKAILRLESVSFLQHILRFLYAHTKNCIVKSGGLFYRKLWKPK